ncbi:MAG: GGDEF domain-containing protein [Okeania sp. SIO2H7]|nr:GGDEF domain-containing protein [Okeania sp. SIO2H7]
MRKGDSVGRFGGEEFVAFLPETNLDDGMKVANRIRTTIAELSLFFRTKPVKMTVSVGVTEYSKEDLKIDDLIQRADKALYHAKHRGRNLVVGMSLQDLKSASITL